MFYPLVKPMSQVINLATFIDNEGCFPEDKNITALLDQWHSCGILDFGYIG